MYKRQCQATRGNMNCGSGAAGAASGLPPAAPSDCPSGVMQMLSDCDGVCVPANYLGDKICDSGQRGANLNCAQHNMDNNDCGASARSGW